MNHFLIKYRLTNGTAEAWHEEVARFISALDNDLDLKGKIRYRCMKSRDDARYWHFAGAVDAQAIKTLQERDYFKAYSERTRLVAGGEVEVSPLEIIAETTHQA